MKIFAAMIIFLYILMLMYFLFQKNIEQDIRINYLQAQLNTVQLQTANTDFYKTKIKVIKPNIKLQGKK